MGRSKAPKAPAYQPSEIKYGDTVIGKTYVDPTTGAIVTQYIPDPAEAQRQSLIQQKINEIAQSLGTTSPELNEQFNQTQNAFIDDAKRQFSDQYDPSLKNLREDTASRFGTLNTSEFFNGLNDLEKIKSNALIDIINRGKMLKNDLVNQNEANKLNALAALNGTLSSDSATSLQNMDSSLASSNALNGFLNSQWMTQLNYYMQNQANKRAYTSSLVNKLGPLGIILGKLG